MTRWPASWQAIRSGATTGGAASRPARTDSSPLGHYLWDEERETFAAHHIAVLTLDGDRIADITFFINAELVRRFGLPDELPHAPR